MFKRQLLETKINLQLSLKYGNKQTRLRNLNNDLV